MRLDVAAESVRHQLDKLCSEHGAQKQEEHAAFEGLRASLKRSLERDQRHTEDFMQKLRSDLEGLNAYSSFEDARLNMYLKEQQEVAEQSIRQVESVLKDYIT